MDILSAGGLSSRGEDFGGGEEVVMPVSIGEWCLCFWDEHRKR